MSDSPLLEVKHLRVEFPTRHGTLVAVDDVSLHINPGEVLGVVGESGAGKSMTGAAIIGLLDPPGHIASGEILLNGKRIDRLGYSEMRKIRGRQIGAIFQDPLTSLNPLYTVGRQLVETIQTHLPLDAGEARQRAIELLAEVGIPSPVDRIDHYPHQFSGGMRQRVVIALAICAEPQLIIADEPTTALDVSIQAQIITLLKRLCAEKGTAIMLVTHDMGVIAETADRVAVMYAGRIGEVGPVAEVIHKAKFPYTVGLMGSIPNIHTHSHRLVQIDGAMPRLDAMPQGCRYHPRCPHAFARCMEATPDPIKVANTEVACWLYAEDNTQALPDLSYASPGAKTMTSEDTQDSTASPLVQVQGMKRYFDVSPPLIQRLIEGTGRRTVKAIDGIDFTINRGETFGLVGESGCGKSTVARQIVGLYDFTDGEMHYDGQSLSNSQDRKHHQATQQKMQMIFQDPHASLNPRWRVKDIVAEPIKVNTEIRTTGDIHNRVCELLEQVGLSAADANRFPHEFSGGQRQRISIARALGGEPEFLVCDEPTSALDVSVQAQILNLMVDLQQRLGLTYLFISHDLAVVHHISTSVGVMYLGHIVEWAPSKILFNAPSHPYTRMLLDAIPDLAMTGAQRKAVSGELPSPMDPPSGCSFHPRCPHANERCRTEVPINKAYNGVNVACHALEESRLPQWRAA